MLQQAREHGVIPVERIKQAIQISRIGLQLRANFQETELIRGGHLSRVILRRLGTQDQQAGIAEPVAEQRHRTNRNDGRCQ